MPSPLYVRDTRWDLVPGRTVHVVIDDQNDFLHADGWYGAAAGSTSRTCSG